MWPRKSLYYILTFSNKRSFPMRHSALCFTLALNGEISLRKCNALTGCPGICTFFLVNWMVSCLFLDNRFLSTKELVCLFFFNFCCGGVQGNAGRDCHPLQKPGKMDECRCTGALGQKCQGRNASDLLKITQRGRSCTCSGLCRLPKHLKFPEVTVKPSSS